MADITTIVKERLEKLKQDIQLSMATNNINASGRTSAFLNVVEYNGGVKLVAGSGARAPMQTIEIGREGGRVPAGFYNIIKQWTRDKGLNFASETDRSTFAYFTAKKIAREGTARHKENVDVYSTLVAEAVKDIQKELQATIKQTIKLNFK